MAYKERRWLTDNNRQHSYAHNWVRLLTSYSLVAEKIALLFPHYVTRGKNHGCCAVERQTHIFHPIQSACNGVNPIDRTPDLSNIVTSRTPACQFTIANVGKNFAKVLLLASFFVTTRLCLISTPEITIQLLTWRLLLCRRHFQMQVQNFCIPLYGEH